MTAPGRPYFDPWERERANVYLFPNVKAFVLDVQEELNRVRHDRRKLRDVNFQRTDYLLRVDAQQLPARSVDGEMLDDLRTALCRRRAAFAS